MATIQKLSIWDPALVRAGLVDAVRKLDPRVMVKNPVMFVVEVGAGLTTILLIRDIVGGRGGIGFELQITIWLWATVLFANSGRSHGGGTRQGAGRHAAETRTETVANRFTNGGTETVPAASLRRATRHGARPANSSRRTARLSRASLPSTSPPSPASPLPSSARPAATVRPSRAARACCRTGSRSG